VAVEDECPKEKTQVQYMEVHTRRKNLRWRTYFAKVDFVRVCVEYVYGFGYGKTLSCISGRVES